MTRVTANALLLLAGATWGMGFIAQSTAMDDVGPFLFIAARFAVACAVVAPLAWFEAKRAVTPITIRDHSIHAMVGVALFLGMAFQQVGLLTTTVTNSGFLTGLYVVFVPFVAIALFREWPHRIVWPSVVIAVFGVYLLAGASLASFAVGDVYTVICAAFWALQVVLIGRFVRVSGRPIALALMQFAVTGVLALLIAVVIEPIEWSAIRAAGIEILYAGTLASGLAFTIQIVGQRYTTAPQAAIMLSSESLFAALFGTLLLGEVIGPLGLLGCALILVAMLMVEIVPALRRSPSLRTGDESVM